MSPSPEPDARQVIACPSCGRRNRIPAAAAGMPRCGSCHQPLPWLTEADDDRFAEQVRGPLPVLVDLWAPWCGPCRTVSPAVEHAARSFAGQLKVLKVNVDDAPGVARRFTVRGVPTLLMLRDGAEVARQVGAVPAAALTQWVSRHLRTRAA
jgi:thioredoxin 2